MTCANAARIWKAYGTVARKGDSILGRPHRISRILEVPSDQRGAGAIQRWGEIKMEEEPDRGRGI